RPVLANAPSLVFEASLARRDGQLVITFAGADVLLRIERREVPPEDLPGPVSLDALGSEVPRGHVPGDVEQEDRIIADALHEQVEALLDVQGGARGYRSVREVGLGHGETSLTDERRGDNQRGRPSRGDFNCT